MKTILITTFLAFVFQIGYSQQEYHSSDGKQKSPLFSTQNLEYSAGYFGNFLWNPGLKFGAEALFIEKQKTKLKKRKGKEFNKIITKQILIDGDIGFYLDPQSHVGIFTTYGVILRRTNNKQRQLAFKFNPLGYFRSFYPETYEVKNGKVNKLFLPGRSYYAPSISIGIGKLRAGKKLNARFLNLNFMILVPYNTNFLPVISIEYGYRFGGKPKLNKL